MRSQMTGCLVLDHGAPAAPHWSSQQLAQPPASSSSLTIWDLESSLHLFCTGTHLLILPPLKIAQDLCYIVYCVWIQACACHGAYMEFRGQPDALVLTFHVVWERFSSLFFSFIHQTGSLITVQGFFCPYFPLPCRRTKITVACALGSEGSNSGSHLCIASTFNLLNHLSSPVSYSCSESANIGLEHSGC